MGRPFEKAANKFRNQRNPANWTQKDWGFGISCVKFTGRTPLSPRRGSGARTMTVAHKVFKFLGAAKHFPPFWCSLPPPYLQHVHRKHHHYQQQQQRQQQQHHHHHHHNHRYIIRKYIHL
jgi:hypothetical protein